MDSFPLTFLGKAEIKIVKSNYITDDIKEFENDVNELLKDGWVIQSTACSSATFFESQMVMHRHSYTAILYRETFK